MAKYTTQVRSICEVNSGLSESKGQTDVNDIIANSREHIFDFTYPIFSEEYRSVLETKILKHYYMREICAETVGLWKLFLDARMNEIMPYYNKLYESELIQFDPLKDTDITRESNRSGEENGVEMRSTTDNGSNRMSGTITDNENTTQSRNEANKNDHWDYYSDTPQGTVGNLADLTYLTNARHITDDGTGSTSNTNVNGNNTRTYNTTNTLQNSGTDNSNKRLDSTEDYIEHVFGKTSGVSYMHLIQELRDNFLNIDMLIIRDLSDLFFGLWE